MFRSFLAFAFVSVSLSACAASASPPVAPTVRRSEAPRPRSTTTAAPASPAKTVRERCDGAGQWSIAAGGSGLARFEGKRVWLSAVERDTGVVVLLESRVMNGSFSFACAKSLHTNYAYPTFAVVIDDDGDGRCSAGDAQSAAQLYGWNEDVDHTVEDRFMQPVRTAHTVVGDRETFDFCALYFPGP